MRFLVLVLFCTACGGAIPPIPVPTSVTVQKMDSGIQVCTTVAADLRPLDGGAD